MPSTSVRQQHYFGMVESGQLPRPKGMTAEQVREFAATSTKGLPYRAAGPKAKRRRRLAQARAGL